jgi:hypothetical protein
MKKKRIRDLEFAVWYGMLYNEYPVPPRELLPKSDVWMLSRKYWYACFPKLFTHKR